MRRLLRLAKTHIRFYLPDLLLGLASCRFCPWQWKRALLRQRMRLSSKKHEYERKRTLLWECGHTVNYPVWDQEDEGED